MFLNNGHCFVFFKSLPSNGLTRYISPSLRLLVPNSLQAYRNFFFSEGCACDVSARSHLSPPWLWSHGDYSPTAPAAFSLKSIYDWGFTTNQFVLVPSPLRPTTSIFLNRIFAVIVLMSYPLWREDGSAVYNCYWVSPAQSFSGPSHAGLMIIFYCLRLETPPTWRARFPYLYLPGTLNKSTGGTTFVKYS
jgi:hypothetical protein